MEDTYSFDKFCELLSDEDILGGFPLYLAFIIDFINIRYKVSGLKRINEQN